MTKYIEKDRAKYWPISRKLMAQYRDGSHTEKDRDGNLIWNKNGKRHRDGDKPAYIDPDGRLEWWQNDKLHRDGDLPAIIRRDGRLGWYQNGLVHRDGDKPAVIWPDGHLAWHQNGEPHRFGGPAVIFPDRELAWYINGENITQEVDEWLNGKEWKGTPEQIVEFQLRFT